MKKKSRSRNKKRLTLNIEPTLPFMLNAVADRPSIRTIWLIGAGGTGSQILAILARTLYHSASQSPSRVFRLVVIDGDVVEEKNVGRQNFAPFDVGFSKAEILAARYNSILGTQIEAIHAFFTPDLGHELSSSKPYEPSLQSTLVVSAVDNNAARRQIAAFIKSRDNYGSRHLLWADVGNEAHTGQLVVGNTFDPKDLQISLDAFRRKSDRRVTYLPYAPLVHPEISDPKKDRHAARRAGCAQAVQAEEQSLLINSMAGQVTANAIYSLLTDRPLPYFAVYFSDQGNSVRPLFNTRSYLKRILENQPLALPATANHQI